MVCYNDQVFDGVPQLTTLSLSIPDLEQILQSLNRQFL
jgi:hypothetical protein